MSWSRCPATARSERRQYRFRYRKSNPTTRRTSRRPPRGMTNHASSELINLSRVVRLRIRTRGLTRYSYFCHTTSVPTASANASANLQISISFHLPSLAAPPTTSVLEPRPPALHHPASRACNRPSPHPAPGSAVEDLDSSIFHDRNSATALLHKSDTFYVWIEA